MLRHPDTVANDELNGLERVATVDFGARIGAVGGFEILGLGVAAALDAGASKSRGSSKRDATAGGTVSVGTAAMLTG